ncbi:hypothetical protein, partial [Bacillus subtilis]|uniref:hypothetical protein n=1 Tax=Bacillus subtilis TaxID=1423 RepID=UPI0024ACD43C
ANKNTLMTTQRKQNQNIKSSKKKNIQKKKNQEQKNKKEKKKNNHIRNDRRLVFITIYKKDLLQLVKLFQRLLTQDKLL